MYKVIENVIVGNKEISIQIDKGNNEYVCFPTVLDNSFYAAFKAQINADEAQLEDADGNLMTSEQAKAFVKELP